MNDTDRRTFSHSPICEELQMQETFTGNREGLMQVSDDIWVFDDQPISAAGLSIPIRMTVIRLSNGDLLLHSPVRFSPALRTELERLGSIRYLLAPNVAHWMFLPDWQAAVPDAIMFAVPGLASRRQVRAAAIRIDRELEDGTPQEWADDLEVVLMSAPMFSEVAIFDKRSGTLVLTDIVQNLDPNTLSPVAQAAARFLGISRPTARRRSTCECCCASAVVRCRRRLKGSSVSHLNA